VADTTLLGGPYRAPALRKGDRASCLYRDGDVVVTSWTAAPIPWPRCRRLGGKGGGSGLLVTEELARAVRTESVVALMYWFGVSHNTVCLWRKAFGVGQWETAGSKRLQLQNSAAAADTTRGKRQPKELIRERLRTREERGIPLPSRWAEDGWRREELALLGTLPDAEVAARIGRTVSAVRKKRFRLRIPAAREGRRRPGKPGRAGTRGGRRGA
jgi:hypothetical protein